MKGDALIDRGADGLRQLSVKAARRGGMASKLAQPLAEDSVFLRKLKPSLIKQRAKGAAPTNGAAHDAVPPLPEPERKNTGNGPNPFAVIVGAAAAGFAVAKVVDWRGHAHPRI